MKTRSIRNGQKRNLASTYTIKRQCNNTLVWYIWAHKPTYPNAKPMTYIWVIHLTVFFTLALRLDRFIIETIKANSKTPQWIMTVLAAHFIKGFLPISSHLIVT